MSTTKYNSDFKKEQCWSCQYYGAKRNYCESGIISSEKIVCDEKGTCMNPGLFSSNNKTVSANTYKCSRYKRWGVIENLLSKNCSANEQSSKYSKSSLKASNQKIQKLNNDLDYLLEELDREEKLWYDKLTD